MRSLGFDLSKDRASFLVQNSQNCKVSDRRVSSRADSFSCKQSGQTVFCLDGFLHNLSHPQAQEGGAGGIPFQQFILLVDAAATVNAAHKVRS